MHGSEIWCIRSLVNSVLVHSVGAQFDPLIIKSSMLNKLTDEMSQKCYWAIQAGLLTPLTFAWHRLSPLAAFTSGAYFLHSGRW